MVPYIGATLFKNRDLFTPRISMPLNRLYSLAMLELWMDINKTSKTQAAYCDSLINYMWYLEYYIPVLVLTLFLGNEGIEVF